MDIDATSKTQLYPYSRGRSSKLLEERLSHRKMLYGHWVKYLEEQIVTDWMSYLVTFQFEWIRGNDRKQIETMASGVGKFHEQLVRFAIRRPESKAWRPHRPRLFAYPDYGDSKWKRERKEAKRVDGIMNDRLHYHGILQLSPRGRFVDVNDHLLVRRKSYFPPDGILRSIDAQEITFTPDRPARYSISTMPGSRFEYADLLVL